MLDEFDQYSRDVDRSATRTHLKTFTPKFDLREVKDGYELHGELPGIDQKDIEIEFTDANTLTVKGRTERKYESGTRPAGFVEAPAAKGAITEEAHKATVEDEGAEPTATQVAKKDTKPAPAHKEPEEKYWVSERSVGEFSRSFSFPVRVDQDAVHASMKNGILSILVPKAKKQASKKISIQ
jgi:HSP20 family protein